MRTVKIENLKVLGSLQNLGFQRFLGRLTSLSNFFTFTLLVANSTLANIKLTV